MKQDNHLCNDCHPSRIIDLPPTELPDTSTPDISDIESRVSFPEPETPPISEEIIEPLYG